MAGAAEVVLNRVRTTRARAEGRLAAGDLDEARRLYREACELARPADGDADPDLLLELASMLYNLGEWDFSAREDGLAVAVLNEAASSYRQLARLRPLADSEQRIADVLLRRARIRAFRGSALSAIDDVQQAVLISLERLRSQPGEPPLDAARVVSWATLVLLVVHDDPDLMLGGAEWALAQYRGRALGEAGDAAIGAGTPADHVAAMLQATQVLYAVRTVSGGAPEGLHQALIAQDGIDARALADLVERVRVLPTLRRVLSQLGRHDIAEMLSPPPEELAVVVPALRCTVDAAPAVAELLADLAAELSREVSDVDEPLTPAGRLLALEAHALFAHASNQQVLDSRHRFGDYGVRWARLVLLIGRDDERLGAVAGTLDAADWLAGIISQLYQRAMADEPTRELVIEAADWLQKLHRRVGDERAASAARETASFFSSRGEAGGGG